MLKGRFSVDADRMMKLRLAYWATSGINEGLTRRSNDLADTRNRAKTALDVVELRASAKVSASARDDVPRLALAYDDADRAYEAIRIELQASNERRSHLGGLLNRVEKYTTTRRTEREERSSWR